MEQVNGKFFINLGCVLLLLFSGNVYSECPNRVQPIQQGQAANCSGYLFSPDAESEAYKATQLADLYKTDNEILEKRLKLYMDETQALSKELSSRDNNESIYRFIYFGAGILVTGLIVRNLRP